MSRRLLGWASGLLLALGAGHVVVSVLESRSRILDWLGEGLWATVPLVPEQTVDEQAGVAAFWGGVGSFAVPLVLLGLLVRHLAVRGVPVPAWVGWAVAGWCALGGVMLVPSPFFVGVVPGVLIVLAARLGSRGAGEPGVEPLLDTVEVGELTAGVQRVVLDDQRPGAPFEAGGLRVPGGGNTGGGVEAG